MMKLDGLLEALDHATKQRSPFIWLDHSRPDGEGQHSLLFSQPRAILRVNTPEDFPTFWKAMTDYLAQGYYLAGYLTYEAGVALAGIPIPTFTKPLAWFGVFSSPTLLTIEPDISVSHSSETPHKQVRFALPRPAYLQTVKHIKNLITEGEVYQLNLTTSSRVPIPDSAIDRYLALRQQQPVAYGAYLRTDEEEILCSSPELFFRIDGQQITTSPMKGTATRGRTLEEDLQRAEWLTSDLKNRAENVMIVDLIRNDLGRFCKVGSVQVPELFHVERLSQVWQMTSTITGELTGEPDYRQIFTSLFPSGSVTGTPKYRAMQHIQRIEGEPRGIYTGAIGYIAPAPPQNYHAPSLSRAAFNVAIRTITVHGDEGRLGIGSGITFDSNPAEEYAECQIKTHFVYRPQPAFELIEALLWDKGIQQIERHLSRLADSATYFEYPYNPQAIMAALDKQTQECEHGHCYKVRLLLSRTAQIQTEMSEVTPAASSDLTISISPHHTSSQDVWLFHKTTHRPLYARAQQEAIAQGNVECLFMNERGEITEGATNNVFIERDGDWLTPHWSCGLLRGTARQHILETVPWAHEAILYLADIERAEHIFLCNAIRGIREVRLGNREKNA